MGFVSAIWGFLALLAMFCAFLPLLGILNWLVVPFAAIGVVLGYLAKAPKESGGEKSGRIGFICSVIALCLSMFRLLLGGGII
jgi:hypothetical protein